MREGAAIIKIDAAHQKEWVDRQNLLLHYMHCTLQRTNAPSLNMFGVELVEIERGQWWSGHI